MKFENLTGGAAVGAGLIIWFTHDLDFSFEEVAAMSAGLGAAVTYTVGLIERLLLSMTGKM